MNYPNPPIWSENPDMYRSVCEGRWEGEQYKKGIESKAIDIKKGRSKSQNFKAKIVSRRTTPWVQGSVWFQDDHLSNFVAIK